VKIPGAITHAAILHFSNDGTSFFYKLSSMKDWWWDNSVNTQSKLNLFQTFSFSGSAPSPHRYLKQLWSSSNRVTHSKERISSGCWSKQICFINRSDKVKCDSNVLILHCSFVLWFGFVSRRTRVWIAHSTALKS